MIGVQHCSQLHFGFYYVKSVVRVLRKLFELQKNIISLFSYRFKKKFKKTMNNCAPVGQKFGSSLAGWTWLKISCEVVISVISVISVITVLSVCLGLEGQLPRLLHRAKNLML